MIIATVATAGKYLASGLRGSVLAEDLAGDTANADLRGAMDEGTPYPMVSGADLVGRDLIVPLTLKGSRDTLRFQEAVVNVTRSRNIVATPVLNGRGTVKEMITDTPYLKKIRKYMRYAAEHPYGSWFALPALPINPEGPILTQVLRLAENDGSLVTVCRLGEEEPVCGYVSEIDRGRVLLDCVDPESAEDLPQIRLRIRDLEYVEYGSVADMLLMFANKH